MKVAVVTGSSRGFGKAIAEMLLKRHYFVAVSDLDLDEGQNTIKEFQAKFSDKQCAFVCCDVTISSDLERLVNKANGFGPLHVWVNNAGIHSGEEPTAWRAGYKKVVDVDLTAVIEGTYRAIDQMSSQSSQDGTENCCVVNISSMSGVIPFTLDPIYTASKFGVVGFTQSLFKHPKVRVNAVCPFFVAETTMVKTVLNDPSMLNVIKRLPFIRIEQVVEAVWLCIDRHELKGSVICVAPNGFRLLKPLNYKKFMDDIVSSKL